MNIVLDASGAAALVMNRPATESLATALADASWVGAPDLYVHEVTNIFWKYHRYQHVPGEQCRTALKRALALPDEIVAGAEMALEVFSLACGSGLTAYDAEYAVLARRHDAHLATMDAKLARECESHSIKVIDLSLSI